jgi:ligand-binding SRPBCC domain-containing protein
VQTFEFQSKLWLPTPPQAVFPFFADAANLGKITPAWLHFQIVTPGPIEMGAGTLIDYRIWIHGLPIRWQTRITAWDPPWHFRDEQVKGPYRLWVHDHHFAPQGQGTLATDRVEYVPRGGALVNRLFVRRDIERIFAYRAAVLPTIFDCSPAPDPIS